MTQLTVISGGSRSSAIGFGPSHHRLSLIHGLRSGLLVTVFLISIVFQLIQGSFLSPAVWLPIYGILVGLFSLNTFYFVFSERLEEKGWVHAALFAADALAITLLVHFSGASQSIFFFLYLVDILLAGLVFHRRGAFTQALWTSFLFGALMLMAPQTARENIYFLATLNNLAFFSVAYLSGNLAEQLNFMGRELKSAARRLEVLEDLNRLVVENIASGLITVNEDGVVISANPAAQSILDGVNLIGRPLTHFFPELHLGRNVIAFHEKDRGTQRLDLKFVNRRREKLDIEAVISDLKDDKGRASGHVMLFQDRTELRRLEESLRQKEKLAAVGQLAAGIAHEIRNPLASLSGSVQLMVANPEKYPADDIRLMKIIMREIDRLNDLISEFLDYVRPEPQPDQVVDINKILREVLEMVKLNANLRSDVDVHARLKAHCEIKGRADKLKQAFLNIVINAYQAMDKSERATLEIETFDQQDQVILVIRDSGAGMNDETRTRLFEPFYTTKPKGTGLGLAVTHKILESHQARVQVKSTLGQGTEFIMDFPAERDEYERPRFKQA